MKQFLKIEKPSEVEDHTGEVEQCLDIVFLNFEQVRYVEIEYGEDQVFITINLVIGSDEQTDTLEYEYPLAEQPKIERLQAQLTTINEVETNKPSPFLKEAAWPFLEKWSEKLLEKKSKSFWKW